MRNIVLFGDALARLRAVPDGCVQTCVTSPPFWQLRDYFVEGQIGLEETPGEYVAKLVDVFREVRRVLRDDGTLWLNLGDAYAANRSYQVASSLRPTLDVGRSNANNVPEGLKPKDLIGLPWMTAFALRADGWYLRSDVVWAKEAPMPESMTDRPTRSHEMVFLLSKRARYFYDAAAIREPFADARLGRDGVRQSRERNRGGRTDGYTKPNGIDPSANGGRNKRSVWQIGAAPSKGGHPAPFPPELPELCIRAGSRKRDLVLDPFAGSGTTLMVAVDLDRDYLGVELNETYRPLIDERLRPSLERAQEREALERHPL
jgi:DNA modification methylase